MKRTKKLVFASDRDTSNCPYCGSDEIELVNHVQPANMALWICEDCGKNWKTPDYNMN